MNNEEKNNEDLKILRSIEKNQAFLKETLKGIRL